MRNECVTMNRKSQIIRASKMPVKHVIFKEDIKKQIKKKPIVNKSYLKKRFLEINQIKNFQVLSSKEEQVFLQLNFLKSSLDFSNKEKDIFTNDIVEKMKGNKILGSKLFYGVILGVIIALICIYFISKEVKLWVLLLIAIGIIIVLSIVGYFTKNKIRKFGLKKFDEKLLKMYFKWTKEKLKYSLDDINGRRKFMENLISKFWYIDTHSKDDKIYLQKKYVKLFFSIFEREKKAVFLSLKMFFRVALFLESVFDIFVKNYYNDFIFPLYSIFEIKKNKTHLEKEFFDFLKELNISFQNDIKKTQNPYNICNYDNNSDLKTIFVTPNFCLLNSHSSFLRFRNLWFIDKSNFQKEMKHSIEVELSHRNSEILQNLQEFKETENSKKFKTTFSKKIINTELLVTNENKLKPVVIKLINLSNCEDTDFRKVFENDNLKIIKRQTKESPIVLVKAEAILEIEPFLLCELIYNFEWRQKWDKVLSNFKIIEKINKYTDVIFSLYKSPFGLANREFLQKRYYYENVEGIDFILAFENAVHSSCSIIKGHIRAETIISGYLIKKLDNGKCHLCMISQTDIKGFVPNWIVNYAASKAPSKWMKKLNLGIKMIKEDYNKRKN